MLSVTSKGECIRTYTDDCQARFSAELREYNLVMVWFGADFMLPFKRARLFLSKCPMHVKKQFADDSELRVGMTWHQFKTDMALAWTSAVKKRRMKIDIGIEVEEKITDVDAQAVPLPPVSGPVSPISVPAPAFNSGIDDVMIDLDCKEEGCGVFKYSQQKIQWLRDKFGSDFKMPSRCVKHKAIVDAERRGSPPKNPDVSPSVPDSSVPISVPPVKNRFGSRRTPNAATDV